MLHSIDHSVPCKGYPHVAARLPQFCGADLPSFRVPFVIALVLMCIVPACVGVPRTRIYASDIFLFLDGGWRVLNGQHPHVDFSTALGPVVYLVTAAGLAISRGRVGGIGYGDMLVGMTIGLWSYALLSRRYKGGLVILGSLWATALAIAPFPLGEDFSISSHAMAYNRWGYALLSLVLLECYPSPKVESRQGRFALAGGFSTGLLCAILLFLKVTYSAVGMGLVVISFVLWRHSGRARILGLFLGFLLFTLAVLVYLHFDLTAVLRDMRMAAVSRLSHMPAGRLVDSFLRNIDLPLLGTGLLALGSTLVLPVTGIRGILRFLLSGRLAFIVIAVYLGGAILLATNAQRSGFPLSAAVALIVLNHIWDFHGRACRSRTAMLTVLGLLVILPPFIINTAGLACTAWESSFPPAPDAARFSSPRLSSIVLYDYEGAVNARSNGSALASNINDGTDILKHCTSEGDHILTFDVYNPFPFALKRTPPRGGMVGAVYNYTFCDRYHPAPDVMFGDADVVMFPKSSTSDPYYFDGLVATYALDLEKRFVRQAESSGWILYRRSRPLE